VIVQFAGTDLVPLEKLLVTSMIGVFLPTIIQMAHTNPQIEENIPILVLQVIKLHKYEELAIFIPLMSEMDTKNLMNIKKSLSGSEKLISSDFVTNLDQTISSRTDASNPQSGVRNIINKFAFKGHDDKQDTSKNH